MNDIKIPSDQTAAVQVNADDDAAVQVNADADNAPSVLINEDKQADSVVRFLFDRHGVRGEIVHMDEPALKLMECVKNHPACVKKLLLDLASAAVLMAATLKTNGTVTVQIQCGKGSKALRFAFINIDRNLNFYGNVLGDKVTDPDASFSDLIGSGAIMVISAFPEGGTRYQGIVSLDKPTMAECLEEYFRTSEQLDSMFFIHSDPQSGSTGGIMLQIIPNVEDNHESFHHLGVLAATLQPQELYELSLNECLRRLYWDDTVRVFEPEPVNYQCSCSKDRIIRALKALNISDITAMVNEEPDGIDMSCQSCGKSYHVSHEELEEILDELYQNQENVANADDGDYEQDKDPGIMAH